MIFSLKAAISFDAFNIKLKNNTLVQYQSPAVSLSECFHQFSFSSELPDISIEAAMCFQNSHKIAEPSIEKKHECGQTIEYHPEEEDGKQSSAREVFIKHIKAVSEVEVYFKRRIVGK